MPGIPGAAQERNRRDSRTRTRSGDACHVDACAGRSRALVNCVIGYFVSGRSEILGGFFRKALERNRSRIALPPQLQRQIQEATILLFTAYDQTH